MNAETVTSEADTRQHHVRWMLLARICEDKLAALYRQGRIPGGVYLGRGQEAASAALGLALRPGDVFLPMIRDLAGRLAFGEPLLEVARTDLGRVTGVMRGRDGNIHRGDLARGILPMVSHLGSGLAPCVGALLARRLRGELSGHDTAVAATVIGDGGMQTGAAHEAINAAAVEGLPLVVMVANNQYAYSTPNSGSFACRDLVDRAIGYGIRGVSADGQDFDACRTVVADAVARARHGGGPQLVSVRLLRLCGHGEHDDASYVDPALRTTFADCLPLATARLDRDGILDADGLAALEGECRAAVEAAFATALDEPEPRAADEDWCAYADPALRGESEEGV